MTGARPAYFGGRNAPPARYNPGGTVSHAPAKPVVQRPAHEDSIIALVNAILAAQEKPLKAAEAQRTAQEQVTRQQMLNAQSGIIGALQAQVPKTDAAYAQAVQSTDQLGRQAASYFQGQSPDAANQALLASIGAPVAQQQALHAQTQGLFNGGPGYVLGAQIPGASLAAQRAAAVSYAQQQPGIAASQGGAAQQAFELASRQAHQSYLNDLLKVQGQVPALVQQYKAQQAAQVVAAQNAQTKAAAAYANAKYLAAQLGLKGKALDLAVQKEANAYAVATRNANIAAQRAGTYQQSVDQAAKKNAAAVAKTTAATGAKATKARATAVRNRGNARVAALTAARSVKGVVSATKTTPGKFGGTVTQTVKTKRPYREIKAEAMSNPKVQLLWTRYGYSRAQVSKMVDEALAGKGIRPKSKPRPKRRGKNPIPVF